MKVEAVLSFIHSLAHREKSEVAAVIRSHGSTTEVSYRNPLDWPWPRQFAYTSEFFCIGLGSNALSEVKEAPTHLGEHVANLF